ncbi:hypothetical protein PAHAL_4G350700 [Panicum hallii]|uniref:Uncharacterized protein n=1 Tax=Panicum hallii TaxID=206008 RepID=A0A2T8JF34_9POAL|nr:uncharacterized protein LOC112890686 [Panicum hallii]PVH48530.1 hypothetical protein PAHAL_4G350700 [Panicum hallii]
MGSDRRETQHSLRVYCYRRLHATSLLPQRERLRASDQSLAHAASRNPHSLSLRQNPPSPSTKIPPPLPSGSLAPTPVPNSSHGGFQICSIPLLKPPNQIYREGSNSSCHGHKFAHPKALCLRPKPSAAAHSLEEQEEEQLVSVKEGKELPLVRRQESSASATAIQVRLQGKEIKEEDYICAAVQQGLKAGTFGSCIRGETPDEILSRIAYG